MTATTTLIALAPEYAAIIDEMLEAGGDLSDEDLAQRLNAIEESFADKVERCQMAYRKIAAESKAVMDFARPYVELAARREAAAERLKGYVFRCMEIAGQQKVETPLGGARLQNSPPSVVLAVDAHDLPVEFQRVTVAVDAKAVIEAAKAGRPLPAGVAVKQSKHLRWL